MRPITMTVGPFAAASATNIRTASSIAGAGAVVLNGSTVSGGVATLDTQRQILFTSSASDVGITFTIRGTNNANATITEVLTGGVTTAVSVLSYKTVTSVVASGASAGTVSIGTNGVATSPLVRFDDWAPGPGDIMCVVSGTINYSVQFSDDDPNSPTNPVAEASMTWVATPDAALTAAATTLRSVVAVVPVFARVLVNSQTNPGSLTATFRQAGIPA
jgi:hypothetical protein